MKSEKINTISPDQGQSISVVGDTYRTLMSGKQTGGAYAAIDMLVPPGGGPGPHAHPDIQESFYVLQGEVVVRSEEQTYTAREGSFVDIPKGGIVHNFKNESDAVAHLLCYVAPAGLEEFFEEIGQPVEQGTFLPPPEMTPEAQAQLKEVAERHGQKLFPPDYLTK